MKWVFDSDAPNHECSLDEVTPGEVVYIEGFFYMVMERDYAKDYINCVRIHHGEIVPFNENTVVEVYPTAKLNIK